MRGEPAPLPGRSMAKNLGVSTVVSLLLGLPLLFLAVFYFYPLGMILRLSLAPEGRLDLSPFITIASSAYFRDVIWFSTWQALLSTGLTLAAALPAAYLFARYEFRGKTLLRALATIPFVMPTVVVAAAFGALLGPRGAANAALQGVFGFDQPPIRLQQTLALVLVAHVFYNYTLVLRIVGGFWANLDPQIEQAAAVLGARRLRIFREITLPLLLPALGSAALLIFIFTFSAFGTILLLGGPRFATVEVEIYNQALTFRNMPLAAALSLIQIAATLAVTALYTRLQRGSAVPLQLRPQATIQHQPHGLRARSLQAGVVLSILLLLVMPLLALSFRSLTIGDGVDLRPYTALLERPRRAFFSVPPIEAIRNSLLFAGAAVILSLAIGLPAAYLLARRRGHLQALLDPLFMLPLGTSAVTLGFGYIVTFDEPPLNLRASPLLVPLAHTLIALPFVVRALLPVLRSIDPRLHEAAAMLGASPLRALREIDLPILARGLAVAAIFAFTVSMGEFGATLLVSRPEYPTMPVVIFRFLGQPGLLNYGQALAMSTLLMLVTAAGFILIERLRYRDIGEF